VGAGEHDARGDGAERDADIDHGAVAGHERDALAWRRARRRERDPDLRRRQPDRAGQEDRGDREVEAGPGPVDQAGEEEAGLG
jgi:hypothetical protein